MSRVSSLISQVVECMVANGKATLLLVVFRKERSGQLDLSRGTSKTKPQLKVEQFEQT